MPLIDNNMSSENIRTVKELILDEQKLVTYLSLSKDLCIHVNEAKVLLGQVVDEIKENDTSIRLNVTFLISGLTSNNAGRTTVCPETELNKLKETFKKIFYQHIYSVCQSSTDVDKATLANMNRFDDILLCAGLIKSTICNKRSTDEIGNLKSNSQKAVTDVKTILPNKKETKEKTSNGLQESNKSNEVVKGHESKSEPVIKTEVISPKKGTSNGKSTPKNGVKPSKGIQGFFTKSNSAPSATSKITKNSVKTETQSEVKKESEPVLKQEKNISVEDECMDIDIDEEIPVKKIKKEPESVKKTNSKKNSTLNQIKKNAKVDKKRKRVLHVSDSDSDDNDPCADEKPSNVESEDEIPPTPTVNTVKITCGILNPKKKRKVVDKTYTDEEGYILTRKEEVYESCSDEEVEDIKPVEVKDIKPVQVKIKQEKENLEENNKVKAEVSPKEKKAKNSKKKVSPPQKGKQPNIMSFFKKV